MWPTLDPVDQRISPATTTTIATTCTSWSTPHSLPECVMPSDVKTQELKKTKNTAGLITRFTRSRKAIKPPDRYCAADFE